MNKTRINQLADYIESLPPKRFDMRDYFGWGSSLYGKRIEEIVYRMQQEGCQTPACVAGWTLTLFYTTHFSKTTEIQIPYFDYDDSSPAKIARKILELHYKKADALFHPSSRVSNSRWNPYDATPQQAAKVLRHLAATGAVDWSVAVKQEAV